MKKAYQTFTLSPPQMFLQNLTLPTMTVKPFISLQTHNYLPAMFLEEDLVQRKLQNNSLTVPLSKGFHTPPPGPLLIIVHLLNLLVKVDHKNHLY